MMLIKVIENNKDSVITRVNGSLKEIARYYFQNDEIKEIQILKAEDEETEWYIKYPLKIYRASKEEIERYELEYTIRCIYVVYHKDTEETEEISCGLI